MLRESDPRAVEVTEAIRFGDVATVRRLLDENPGLAREYIRGARGTAGTLLHTVTNWPGFFPNGPEVTQMLLEAGADPNAPATGGRFGETPLHLTASSDDADVALALIDGGADLETPDGSIGTPLDNAIGYGCWNVARLLVSRGARVEKLWHAAALGMYDRLIELLAESPPSADELTEAFFQACSGGQRRAAELLLTRGADVNAATDYGKSPIEAASGMDTQRELLVEWLRDHGARPRGTTAGSELADLPLARRGQAQAALLDRQAAVLHVEQPGRLGDLPRPRGGDAQLQPQRGGTRRHGLPRDVRCLLGGPEHVDQPHRLRYLG
jgi:ankyrin repeat protein